MARLKFYTKGWDTHSKAFHTMIPEDKLPMIHKKICRHFWVHPNGKRLKPYLWPVLVANRKRGGGTAYLQRNYIKVGKETSFGVLCHELAHIYNYKRWGKKATKHNKKLAKTIKRFVDYCEKKDYWGLSQLSTSLTAGQAHPSQLSPASAPCK